MRVQPTVSAEFLADLDAVCPKTDGGDLPFAFLNDLDAAYTHAQSTLPQEPSLKELNSLAEDLLAWRKSQQRLLQQYLAKLPDDDPSVSPMSLFATMDYGRLETAHTRALAWLLGKNEHGFGNQLLEALLQHVLKDRRIRLTKEAKVEAERSIPDGRRIDILADCHWEEQGQEVALRLVIEAKIDAEEGHEQLAVYDRWLRKHPGAGKVLRVFLTLEGREPKTALNPWQSLRFVDLASTLNHAASGLKELPGYHFLRYYLTGVLRDVCGAPVPIRKDSENPYAAVEYLGSVLSMTEAEDEHGHPG